jgi:hypothetical protein
MSFFSLDYWMNYPEPFVQDEKDIKLGFMTFEVWEMKLLF